MSGSRRALRLMALALFPAVLWLGACSGDDDDGSGPTPSGATAGLATRVPFSGTPAVTPSTGGTSGGPSPVVLGPASRYAPTEEDLGGFYRTSDLDTFLLDGQLFAQIGPFVNAKEGVERAKQWEYEEGYVAAFDPEGLLSSVVRGNYYVTVHVHRFRTVEGATAAFRQFKTFYDTTSAVETQSARQLGNESGGWRGVSGKLGPSDIDAVYHRFVFRRGNTIAQVETYGGVPFMTIDQARDVAILIDEKLLGQRPSPVPTPSGTPGQLPPTTPPAR